MTSMHRSMRCALLALVALVGACSRQPERPPVLADASRCPKIGAAEAVGTVGRRDLDELSGLVASRRHAGVFWTHNDSGAGPVVVAIRASGEVVAEVELVGVEARDWEDIAVGPGPEPGVDYLYVGDIGDNKRQREGVVIHRVREPATLAGPARIEAGEITSFELRYADGAENAEALVVDRDGAIFVISKGERAHLYKAVDGALARQATLDVGEGALVTGADLSPGGDLLAVRTYGGGYLWARAADQSLAEAVGVAPCAMGLAKEPQGEAIAFAADGAAIYTVSEFGDGGGPAPPIYRVSLAR